MKTKPEIQIEIDNVQREAQRLTQRRAELVGDRDKTAASTEARTQTIGAGMIEGQDVSKESDALNRDRAKLAGTDAAIGQIDSRLQQLQIDGDQGRVAYARVDFDRLTNEADKLFLAAVDQYRAALSALEALQAKFAELHGMGHEAGISADNDDHLRLMEGLYRHLHSSINAENHLLGDDVMTRVVAEARVKKGG